MHARTPVTVLPCWNVSCAHGCEGASSCDLNFLLVQRAKLEETVLIWAAQPGIHNLHDMSLLKSNIHFLSTFLSYFWGRIWSSFSVIFLLVLPRRAGMDWGKTHSMEVKGCIYWEGIFSLCCLKLVAVVLLSPWSHYVNGCNPFECDISSSSSSSSPVCSEG